MDIKLFPLQLALVIQSRFIKKCLNGYLSGSCFLWLFTVPCPHDVICHVRKEGSTATVSISHECKQHSIGISEP